MPSLDQSWYFQPEQAELRKSLLAMNVASATSVDDHIGKKCNNPDRAIREQNQEAVSLYIRLSDKQMLRMMNRFQYKTPRQILWGVTGRPLKKGRAGSKESAEAQVKNLIQRMRILLGRKMGTSCYVAGHIVSDDNSKAQLELDKLINTDAEELLWKDALEFNGRFDKAMIDGACSPVKPKDRKAEKARRASLSTASAAPVTSPVEAEESA